jgi:nicotinate-nucleotide adenylyltransferase
MLVEAAKNKIAILGLAADPITLGHEQLAQAVMKSGIVNEVWFMPCFSHMFGKNMVNFEHRFNMCNLVSAKLGNRYFVSRYEASNGAENRPTYITMKEMTKISDNDFYIVIGADNANKIDLWKFSEEIRREFPFIVHSRKGVTLTTDWFLKPPHHYLETDVPNVSSTSFRELYQHDKEAAKVIVNPLVYDYIQDNCLYVEKTV